MLFCVYVTIINLSFYSLIYIYRQYWYIGCPSWSVACLANYKIVIFLANSMNIWQLKFEGSNNVLIKGFLIFIISSKVVMIWKLSKNHARKVCIFKNISLINRFTLYHTICLPANVWLSKQNFWSIDGLKYWIAFHYFFIKIETLLFLAGPFIVEIQVKAKSKIGEIAKCVIIAD